ncbi:hypothetical protein GH714_006422 [Hevea brasiliensis]|uniref:Uncharacterized protein n=1 Tax=Hevea brasiliensis TaxID=3981 RepID=A0A6A6MC39_HEVBR|nr:hypothetical protein GH714_006422 [Hevea brasiliensis]
MSAEMGRKKEGYGWAVSAGINAALAAIAAKFFYNQFVRYSLVVICNVTMWGCYVNSLKVLSSLQATVTNFATNFLSSGLAGFLFFEEALSAQLEDCILSLTYGTLIMKPVLQWFAGALLIVIGVVILSKSSIERKPSID